MCSLIEKGPHPVEVGQRTEAVILCELVRLSYRVLTPFGYNHRYDLVLHVGDRFVRVQCKTGGLRKGAILFPTRSTRSNQRSVHTRPYDGEVDLFMVHCPDNGQTYAIPVDQLTQTAGSLRVHPAGNGQVKGIRWAADYELSASTLT